MEFRKWDEERLARIKRLWLKRQFPHPWRLLVPGIVLGVLLFLEIYSRSAAMIFNMAMEEQELLRGTITAERILATPFGHVSFEELEWKDPEGRRILYIPDGGFTVDILDALLLKFSSTSIERLEINRASLSIRLDENMNVDFVRAATPPRQQKKKPTLKSRNEIKTEAQLLAEGEERRKRDRERMTSEWNNFNLSGERLDLDLLLDNCKLEIFYKERHYLLDAVRLNMDVDTKNKISIKLATGPFGGTMVGSGLFLDGKIDCRQEVPQCDLTLLADEIDPSSLGFGMDLHDPFSMMMLFDGDLAEPVGRGTLHFDRLRIPALTFSNVDGDIQYENALLRVADLHADVYGGELDAQGWYNIDTRYYHIEGHGSRLQARKALPDAKLYCLVELDIGVDCKGSVQSTSYGGTFVSSEGRYNWMPFRSLQGRFHNLGKNLDFYDVKIDFGGIVASTDAFNINHGKLTLNPIHVTDEQGNPIVMYDPDKKDLIDMRPEANGSAE